jgi:hypothetical protein
MSLNFNVDPYYDDFDPTKNYHRILFKPGYAVQARELTQSQTILQNQISRFASAIYSQNTPVSGGQVTTNLKCNYIKLLSSYAGITITASSFLNQTITDSTGTIVARVIKTAEATIAGDPPTLIVSYLSGTQFSDAMTVYINSGTTINAVATTIGVLGGTTSVGSSSVASIAAGIFYVVNGYNTVTNADGTTSQYSIGNFTSVSPQTVILDKYDNYPTLRVGLNIVESVTTSSSDISLLDPATGASNYQAPGADRYQISLNLETRPLTLGNDNGFIELLQISAGQILKQTDTTVYSTIDDYFAKRTYDTNGDFIVNNFNITPASNAINSATYDIGVGPGIAYVHGYRIENQSQIKLNNPRARTTYTQNNNPVFVDYGNFVYVDTLKGLFDVTQLSAVDLHCVPYANVATANTTVYNSTKVGSGFIRNLVYDHNSTDANTLSYVYRAYLTDISSNTLSSNAASATAYTISLYDTNGTFSNVANAYVGTPLTITSGTSVGDSRIVTQYTPATKTFTVAQPFSITPDTTSQVSLKFATTNIVSMANTSGLTINAKANINAGSKSTSVVGGAGGVSITQTNISNPGSTELLFKIGYPFLAGVNGSSYTSTQVFRSKSFSNVGGSSQIQITLPVGIQNIVGFGGGTGSLSLSSIEQNYSIICTSNSGSPTINVGDVIPFGPGLTFGGANTRTVSVSTDKNTLTLTAQDTANVTTGMTVSIIAKVNVVNGDDTNHIVRAKNLYTANTNTVSTSGPDGIINSNTYIDLTNCQVYIPFAGLVTPGNIQSLYVTDVKRISKIIDTGSANTAPIVSMLTNAAYDITSRYNFDNGQRDNTYDHARITLKPGQPQPKGNILILFDFYKHTGGDGYFTGLSYLSPISTKPESYGSIPTYRANDGLVYNLRDCLDWRPARKNGVASRTYEYTGNPSTDDTGVYIPQDLTNFVSNYSYYLARNDLLVISKDKTFKIISGVPSVNPSLPTAPDGSLIVSNLYHDPYTAYLPSEAPNGILPNLSVQAVKHQRFTMQDIADLQSRVNNIEYYTSLSMLEQKTQTLQVTDSNGLNRFKNGILVDSFSSYATVDTGNPDFNCSIDTIGKIMSAPQYVTNYPLQSSVLLNAYNNLSNTALSGLGFGISTINQQTNIFSLPYTPTAIINQQLASNTVNLNPFTTPLFEGSMTVNPPMDNWVDNTTAPDLLLVDPNLQVYQQSNTLNTLSVGNWQVIPGSQYSTSSTYSVVNHGAFNGPFGDAVGYTATSTQTYASQSQKTVSGYWSQLPATYSTNNGFITNISIQPYIRAQDLVILAGSLKINTPLTTSFDGTIVDQYINLPTVIELTGVTGTFARGDLIGYVSSGNWNTLGKVVDVYNYPNTTNTRLYAFVSRISMTAVTLSTIQNGKFNSAGVYTGTTASGTPQAGTINGVTLNMSGGVISANNGTSSNVTGGGTYTTGVTQFVISPLASNTSNFYTGSTISITSTNGTATTTQTATVTAYDGPSKTVTVNTAVPISLGYNSNVGSEIRSVYRITGNKNWSNNTSYLTGITNGVAPQISTNEAGNFSATFSIPASIFQNGARIFRVDNRTVPSDGGSSATTYASATFTASGLSTTSQKLDFSASIDSAPNTFVATQYKSNQLVASTFSYAPYDPVAQTFIIDKANYPNGAFLYSVKLFFQSKPTTSMAPVNLWVHATTNGYPNGKSLDYSSVSLTPDQVNVSSNPHYLDSTTYTEFVFSAPVFIQPGVLYAFVVKSPSTEYNLYTAAQGSTAISSTVKNLPTDVTPTTITKIGTTPYVGSLFKSQNAITWVANPAESMMFVVNQALFNTSVNPKLQFVLPAGLPTRKSVINVVHNSVQPNTVVNLDNTLSSSNVIVDAFNITTTDLLPTSTSINYTYNATLSSTGALAGETSIQPGRYGSPTLNNILLNDGYGTRVLNSNSSQSFFVYGTLSSTDPNVSPIIADDGLSVYNVDWIINNLPLSNTQITLVSGGTGYNTNTTSVTVSAPDLPGGVQAVAAANVANGSVQSVYVTSGGSGYLATPTITIVDANTAPGTGATINTVSEFSPRGGNALTRYITKKVVLAPGNDSGDLRVFATAYRPVGTNIYVMYKILSSADTSSFDAQPWQLMTPIVNQAYYSNSYGATQEIEYAPGINNVANNYISYTSSNGSTFTNFIQFSIKVVMTTADNTNVPYLSDIRALALPPGTGI